MEPKTAVFRIFFPLRTTNVAYFQRKIQLSGFSAYPDGSPYQLIRISGVLLYLLTLLCSCCLKKSGPITGLDRPRGFQKVKVPRFHDTAQDDGRLSALRTGRLYPQEMLLLLISVRD